MKCALKDIFAVTASVKNLELEVQSLCNENQEKIFL